MIKGNKLDVLNIDFELQAKRGDNFLYFALFFMVFAQVVVYATSAMSIIYGGCWCYKKLHYHDYYYYYFTELFISLQQDVQLRWGLDHNVTFSMGK